MPTGVFAATSDWGTAGEHGASGLVARIDRAATELARALEQRGRQAAGSGGAEVIPFAELLAR
jgi:FMN reductase